MRFKTKEGVYLQAIQVSADNRETIEALSSAYCITRSGNTINVEIPTPKGSRTAKYGDFIITGPDGVPNGIITEDLMHILFEEAPPAKKAMLSQPMAGKTDEEIVATRNRAIAYLESMGYEVVNTLFTDYHYSKEAMDKRGVVNIPLQYLAKSVENMSLCHVAYFCKGWDIARGCVIEHEAAKQYGLEIIYEDDIFDDTDKPVPSSDDMYMIFHRDHWDDFVKFTEGHARNITIERRPNGKCTCMLPCGSEYMIVNEGDKVIKDKRGKLWYLRKDSNNPIEIKKEAN